MSELYSILDIKEDLLEDFSNQARLVDNFQIERIINKNIRMLNEIASRGFSESGLQVSQQTIEKILFKVVEQYNTQKIDLGLWTIKELRIISYNISRFQDERDIYKYAFKLLDQRWRNMYLNGLIFVLMNSWIVLNPDFKTDIYTYIANRFLIYKDNNKRYLNIKNHLNLLDLNGPSRMAALLISKDFDIFNAPNILGFSSSSLFQSYYSDVIIKFYEKSNANFEKLEKIFSIHKHARTKKILFAHLVEKADKMGDVSFQTLLSHFINSHLGDVTLVATWAPFPGATYEEAQKLKHAKELVTMWLKRRIIETFFEVCVQDYDRKRFWLEYVQYVSDFKIVGSKLTKRLLDNDSRINTMYMSHFIQTNSRYSQTAALILCIKDRVMVEFSDVGALYAYKQDNQEMEFIKDLRNGKKYISSINELKQPSLNNLVDGDWGWYYHEGRLMHIGYWQERLRGWLQQMVLSDSNTEVSFFETKDDDVFTAQPLPKEEGITKFKPITSLAPTNNEPSSTSNNTQQLSIKDSTFTPKSKTFKYETSVSSVINSKLFIENTYRVVCNSRGYYINIIISHKYVFLKKFESGVKPSGSIWVKKTDSRGWMQIVHIFKGIEYAVGVVKRIKGGILYKEDLKNPEYMYIK